ncbi:MAG: hypothetical protein ACOX6T_12820 [Myxococcales bacterium]|jgi:hypothetical protein
MSEVACAICQARPEEAGPLQRRPLVAPKYLDTNLFSIDPLGTAGATVELCAECSELIGLTLLHSSDLEQFAKAIELHRDAHAPAGPSEQQAARIRLWHRAIHLGLRALVAELSEKPPVQPARPEPNQLGLFVSKTARLAKVEAALLEGDLRLARELSLDLVRRFDMPEARYLAVKLALVEERVAALEGDAQGLARLAEHPEKLLEAGQGGRITVSLASAFARGVRRYLEARS